MAPKYTFGQDRLAGVTTAAFLQGLYATGRYTTDYLDNFRDKPLPEVTHLLLQGNIPREDMEVALRIANGQLDARNPAQLLQTLVDVNPKLFGNRIDEAREWARTMGQRGLDPTKADQILRQYLPPQTYDWSLATTSTQTAEFNQMALPYLVNPPTPGQPGAQPAAPPKPGQMAPPAVAPAPAPAPQAARPAGASMTGAAGGGGGGGGGANNTVPNPATWNDDQIRDFIKSNFGANAYFIDIPEVWEALKGVVKSGKGVNGLEPALETTAFWKQNNAAARNWYARSKSDPAQTAADIAQQAQALGVMAQNAGLTVDPDRLNQIAESSLRYGWTNTDIQRALAAEWHYDPTSKNQAAAVTAMKQKARNWLVPLSDQAIQTWGQGLIAGTTTDDQFTQYLRDNAKSLFPQLSSLIDAHTGDANFSVDTFVDPYRTAAANLLGIQPDQVDFMDPKWRKPLDTIDPKTGERRIMTLSEWQSTLKTDQQYGYDKTQNGVNEALNLAQSLTKSMGF